MSQKSSLPQVTQFVSGALPPDSPLPERRERMQLGIEANLPTLDFKLSSNRPEHKLNQWST
jgi:hypothetical protein